MEAEAVLPRCAAWMASLGLPATEAARVYAVRTHKLWEFMAFISRVKTDAHSVPGLLTTSGSITDHEAFTMLCWRRATVEYLERFPAQ